MNKQYNLHKRFNILTTSKVVSNNILVYQHYTYNFIYKNDQID